MPSTPLTASVSAELPLAYPFADHATLTTQEGVKLPRGMFLDAAVYAPGVGSSAYLSSLTMSGQQLTAVVSDTDGERCRGTADLTAGEDIYLSDAYDRPCGVLVLGRRTGQAYGMAEGEHLFDPEATPFVATCLIPLRQPAVSGFRLADGSFFDGDVWLVGKDGVVLKWDTSQPEAAIALHLVGDPLAKKKLCGELDEAPQVPLKELRIILPDDSVLQLYPDGYGNGQILPGSNQEAKNVLRIEPQSHGILIRALSNLQDTSNRFSTTEQQVLGGGW